MTAAFYALKAVGTRARSAAWLARTRGRLDVAGLRILFYHRIADDRDELAVSPVSFRRQMAYLAGESYRVVDVVEAVDLLERGALRPRTIGLSFDDGYLDVAEHALPTLAGHGFRATVFVAPGVIDGSAWFDWYKTPRRSSTGTTSRSSIRTGRFASRLTHLRTRTCSRSRTTSPVTRSRARRRSSSGASVGPWRPFRIRAGSSESATAAWSPARVTGLPSPASPASTAPEPTACTAAAPD